MPVIPSYFQQEMPAVSRPDQAPSASTLPIGKHKFDTPILRIHLNDLAHEGSSIFLSNIKGNEDLDEQVQNVLNLLYTSDSTRPGTRSVTLVLRQMNGVAYTTGLDLDEDHKEIHLNLDYVKKVKSGQHREEMLGVICHELVHCFQWSAGGTCPGGLIEGIADWVRLHVAPAKHWKREAEGQWDRGYQHTGYFLEYLESRFGSGTVRKINAFLRLGKYDEKKLFEECCEGHNVEDLWKDYCEELKTHKNRTDMDEEDPPEPVPTHVAQEPW